MVYVAKHELAYLNRAMYKILFASLALSHSVAYTYFCLIVADQGVKHPLHVYWYLRGNAHSRELEVQQSRGNS